MLGRVSGQPHNPIEILQTPHVRGGIPERDLGQEPWGISQTGERRPHGDLERHSVARAVLVPIEMNRPGAGQFRCISPDRRLDRIGSPPTKVHRSAERDPVSGDGHGVALSRNFRSMPV